MPTNPRTLKINLKHPSIFFLTKSLKLATSAIVAVVLSGDAGGGAAADVVVVAVVVSVACQGNFSLISCVAKIIGIVHLCHRQKIVLIIIIAFGCFV